MSEADDPNIEDEAAGFEEEKTSPELRQRPPPREDSLRPIVVVAAADMRRRGRIVELMRTDGWNALEAQDAQEVLEMVMTLAPLVVMVDPELRTSKEQAIPELIRQHRPDAALRMMALVVGPEDQAERIARALADGFDDFVTDVDNEVKLLTRTSANLKAARNLAQLNKQRRDAALLLELTQTLGSSLDMQLILHTVSRLLAEVITLERCSIILLDPDDDEAVMVAASEDRAVKDLRIQLNKYPEVIRCVETAAPVVIGDVTNDPLLSPVSKALAERGVRTMVLFPIVFEEHVTGVLFLRSSKPRVVSDHEIQFGQTVAAACAVAIRNARLFDQFRDEHRQMRTMQQQAERQTEALRKYQDFFEYAADGISVIDVDGRIHYVNKEGRRLLGRTRDELKSTDFRDLLVEDSARQWAEVVDQVRHGRFQRSFDVYVMANDEERVFSLSAGGVGQGTGLLILSFRDVTEMREMEGELRTTKEFLENLIDSSVDAIVAADMNGNLMLFNKGAELMYGYRAEDVIGRMHVTQLYPGVGAAEVMNRLREVRYGGVGRLAPERREILTASGDIVPVSMSASIIYEDGEEVATVGVFTDLRDRMAIERQLHEARDQLTKAEKARVAAELAGMAAHELNQPLTSVLGYAEMLKARIPEGDVKLRRPIETIFVQAERMAEIVRKIGRVTKYEVKRYGANTDMIDLNRAVDESGPEVSSPSRIPMTATPQPAPGLAKKSRPPEFSDDDFTDPRGRATDGRVDDKQRRSGSSPIGGVLSALMGRAEPSSSADPRAAIVRMDTVDEELPGYARRLRTPPAGMPVTNADPATQTGSFRPTHRSTQVEGVAPVEEDEEHTNPGVKVSDLRRRARDQAD